MRSLGGFSSPWHFLWTSVDRSSSLFLLGICSWLFHNCSRALWLPSHLSHFEASQWSAPEPLSTPVYTPPQVDTPSCFMRSASLFPSQWRPWVSLDITKPHPDTSSRGWEQFRCFGGRNEAFTTPLQRPPNSPAILISLSQLWWVTWQGQCVSSKPCLFVSIYDCKSVRELKQKIYKRYSLSSPSHRKFIICSILSK